MAPPLRLLWQADRSVATVTEDGSRHAGAMASEKAALRKEAMQRRRTLDCCARLAASKRALINLVNAIELQSESMVAAFWPIGAELDTRPLFDVLAALGVSACLPRMAGPKQRLAFYPYRPGNALLEGPMRVLEPMAEGPALRPTIVIVPLLAFDHAGYRLGYGGGFYDRTLPTLPRSTVVVGLAYEAQQVANLPHDTTDVRLKRVVTEAGVHHFA